MNETIIKLCKNNYCLQVFEDLAIKKIAEIATLKTIPSHSFLLNQNEIQNNLYLLSTGEVEQFILWEERQYFIRNRREGDLIGGFSLSGQNKSIISAHTKKESKVFEIPQHIFQQLETDYPKQFELFQSRISNKSANMQLTLALKLNPLFKKFDSVMLKALDAELEIKTLESGDLLCKKGDTADKMYLIIHGKLQIFDHNENGDIKVLREVGRGDTVGEIGTILGDVRTASIKVIRDSSVAILSKVSFEKLLIQFPVMINRTFVKNIMGYLTNSNVKKNNHYSTYSLVSVNPDLPLDALAKNLSDSLSLYGTTLIISSKICDEALGIDNISQIELSDSKNNELIQWLNEQELNFNYLIYVADNDLTQWTKRCLRQTDHLLLSVDALDAPELTKYELDVLKYTDDFNLKKTLLIMHKQETSVASESLSLIKDRQLTQFHHLRYENSEDYQRLVRFLTGKAIGLVLGGGGARGFAHVGVIRAMQELDIPIDIVGGNSFGAIIAAQCAMQWPYQKMIKSIVDFSKGGEQFTLPFVSLFSGKKMDAGFKNMFGQSMIEDLWRKFYCVSCNLSRAKVMLHQSGLLKDAVRYSNTAPGLFPPMVKDGDLLVDGAILNNIPVDIMQELNESGVIIAVDVNIKEEMLNNTAFEGKLSGFDILLNRLNPFSKKIVMPSMIEVISRASTIGGIAQQKKSMQGIADLYLQPPVNNYSLMEYKKGFDIAEKSYEYVLPILKDWKNKTSKG